MLLGPMKARKKMNWVYVIESFQSFDVLESRRDAGLPLPVPAWECLKSH